MSSRVTPAELASIALERTAHRFASPGERGMLAVARHGRDVCWTEDEAEEPLVTIRIATYNRGQLIVDRAIQSALKQDYERFEVLVVGDNCDEATASAVESVKDPRVRFVNLPHRGIYPAEPYRRWHVAGAAPMNAALHLARGDWIAPCDDDDELSNDHITALLTEAKRERLEMVYGRAAWEREPDQWSDVGEWPFRLGTISHGAVMYSLGLRFFEYRLTSWRAREPADFNLWHRMRRAGVRIGFLDKVVYRHYLEARQR